MKTLRHCLTAGLLLCAAVASAQAWNRPLKNAADAVEDAFDRTQRTRGQCRNQVGPSLDGLVDRIDALRRQQFPVQELNQLRFELTTLAQQAPFAACPIGVTEDLQRALDGLEEARIAMWNGGGRDRFGGGGGNRRDRRGDDRNQPGAAFPFVNIAPLRVAPNVPFQTERAVQITVPEVRFDFMQGQGFYLATKFRSFEGDWSEWVTTQLWTVPSNPFQWRNAYNHVLRYSTLAEEDFSNGRFIVHVAVFNQQGQELAFREASFRVQLPNFGGVPGIGQPPVMAARDCGTGPQDPGCMMVRDGAWAMDGATYQGFLTSLRANRSEVMRLQMSQSMFAQQYLTAAQFSTMMDLFSSEVMRLDFAQRAASRLVNPQHAIGLSSKFRSNVFQAQYTQLMASQPAGLPWQPGMTGPMGVMIQPPGFGQPGVVVQPGLMQPGVVVQVPGMTVQVQDPNVPPAVVQPGFVQPGVVQPAVVQPIGMVRDCGTGPNDPGCGLMRNGVMAMDAQVFSGFMRSLRAVMNEITREDMCEKMLARNGLTAMQLGQVLDLFNNEITRLDVAKTAASHVVNPQHALELSTKFNNSFSAEEFVEIYSGQH
ncbi:MAG: DUF4476 domain-containing protein [Myxococcaceae bacterium]|jgi:hypothetical protein|nr:DUF4476 domain-containing protein [Myxococcaceae bacterium]